MCSEYINVLFGEEIYCFFMNDIVIWNYFGIVLFLDLFVFGLVIVVVVFVCVGICLLVNV